MKKRLNYKELSQFYHDLGLFSRSGLSLERGFDTIKKNKRGFIYIMMDGIQHHITRGGALWEGMAKYSSFFDKFQVMIIKSAEESGQLAQTCQALSNYFKNRHKENRRLKASLIYPVILLHGAVMLPPLKYLFVGSLDKSYWSVILPPLLTAYGSLAIIYILWQKYLRTGNIREKLDEILIKLPVLGKLVKGMSLARVFRSLASLYNAGVGAVKTARQASQTAGNAAISLRLSSALPVLENGGTFSDYFSFSGVLSSNQLGLLTVGEQTGTLSETLERMVIQMEEDNKERLTASIKTIGYVVYFIAAVIAAWTVISFYTGYFKVI